MDPKTQENLKMWLNGPVDQKTKQEIRHLLKTDPQKIVDAFYTHLTFGTGGLRGLMGVGSNRVNTYTVRRATQGLANYIHKQQMKNPSVFIGFDSRHHSKSFANEAALVLAANNINVYLFENLRPTPLVSFGCRIKKCQAAIMITASHNPKEYNGYKVYWDDGAQVVPPHDQGIINEVNAIHDLTCIKTCQKQNRIKTIDSELDKAYLKAMEKYRLYPKEIQESGKNLKIVYTSLHGTGITLVPALLNSWGFTNLTLVKEQCIPDGEFPTVQTPNPEEKAALKMGIQLLNKIHADILIATDPDADRVGVAIRVKDEVKLLNGNQIACLCLNHICSALTTQGKMPKKSAFVKTIATTELFKVIAESFGAKCFDVLTGFKYVAEKIREWERQVDGFQYIFGAEESYGYLLGTDVRDKDAVICSALLAEVALIAKLQGLTLIDQLDQIYQKWGVYYEKLFAITFKENQAGRKQMKTCMEKFQKSPPKFLGKTAVVSQENYFESIKIHLKTGKTTPLKLPKANALLFWLEDQTKILIRPSGTEPKIKIYCGVVKKADNSLEKSLALCQKQAEQYLQKIQENITQSL